MPYDLDSLRPFPLDPDALPRVISRREALRRMSRHAIDHRLSSGQWRRVLPRTYLTADTFTESDQWRAALAFAGEGAALSGAAALRAGDTRRIERRDTVLVLVPPANRTRSAAWARVRRTFRPIACEQWTGPRRVEPSRAAADLALEMTSLDDVRTLVARVVQDRRCSVEELGAELAAGPRGGSALLRQALAEVGFGAASAPEAAAGRILRRARITGFEQNAKFRLPNGQVRVLDFYWRDLRACLEIDSLEFHFDRTAWAGTWQRHLELTSAGLSVIHRPPSALRDSRTFTSDIAEWLRRRRLEVS